VYGGILFADRPMDVRTLYVALSRGMGVNEAYFAVTGEQTALDVMDQSMTADWIDLPATSRRAELHGTEPHRPGLLDGPVLRQLVEERHAIVTSLERAEAVLRALPAQRRTLERDIADAQQSIAHASAEYRRAQSVIDTHDRPLRRRKHEPEIEAARRDLHRQPEIAQRAEGAIGASESELARLAARGSEMKALVSRRPELDRRVAEIDGRLGHDLRVRTRIARLVQPQVVIEALGQRPRSGREAAAWDSAAGRLSQQLATHGPAEGTDVLPGSPDGRALLSGRSATERLALKRHSVQRGIEVASSAIELDIGM